MTAIVFRLASRAECQHTDTTLANAGQGLDSVKQRVTTDK